MRSENTECPNFLDKKDDQFRSLHGAMDSHFHRLHSEGVGTDVKHAQVITKLWSSGVLSTSTPKGLQNAAFYVVGEMFSLRGGIELRNLKPSQIKRVKKPKSYVYNEHVSKTQNGTFKKTTHLKEINYMSVQMLESSVQFTS